MLLVGLPAGRTATPGLQGRKLGECVGGEGDPEVSCSLLRFDRRRRQLRRRRPPARLPNLQLRLVQGEGSECTGGGRMPTANPAVSPSRGQADGHGWWLSSGWAILRRSFCWGYHRAPGYQPCSSPDALQRSQALFTSPFPTLQPKAGGRDPQLFLGFLGGWSCSLLGNFNLLQFSWSWKVLFGGAEGSVAVRGCASPQSFPLSAPVSRFFNAFLFQIWEGLTQRFHRVIALDFVGFGFSDKPVSSLGRGFLQLLLAQRLFCHARIPGKLAFAVRFLLPFTSGKGIRL